MNFKSSLLILWMLILILSCSEGNVKTTVDSKLFVSLDEGITGIDFNNKLTETDSINYFTYPYIYMGGGVSTGDLNGDGLPEVFFTGNMVENKLYLNRGNLKFKDVTNESGLAGDDRWMTGTTMADVNNDGLLDIYVCVSGKFSATKNLLYINKGIDSNGVPQFSEEAEKFGLADEGQSTQATFFDFDSDGDLDVYVANYPITDFKSPNQYYRQKMDNITYKDSDHLYQNNGSGTFADITEKAGLLRFGLTLSATVGDLNNDSYPDLYVSNDFASPDYFYLNNGDGTFSEELQRTVLHTSFFGMGVDIADFNNDGFLDIAQMDMTPEDNRRSKANMASMDTDAFWEAVSLGFHHQYMKNTLQMNNGLNAEGLPIFSEISSLSGTATTDWSWATLFLDLDNDGLKDLFVTNGSRREINNKDYFKKIGEFTNPYLKNDGKKSFSQLALVAKMPSEKIDNYVFGNNGDLTFSNRNEDWGISYIGFSNGAAYADLDADGDLEIITNNIDDRASVFQNLTSEKQKNNYFRVKLKGASGNTYGLGAKIFVGYDDTVLYNEMTLTRGFQSSVEPIAHFGVGQTRTVDFVRIIWPDGKEQKLKEVESNQTITLDHKDAKTINTDLKINQKTFQFFSNITDSIQIIHEHVENDYNDYLREPLLPHQTSQLGPGVAVADINQDGLEDFYIGGASESSGVLFVQKPDGLFEKRTGPWEQDSKMEDTAATFFDADGDGFIDLYVVSGGNEFLGEGNALLMDRLYLNDGKGHFTKIKNALPSMYTSGGTVKPYDYDGDGDMDLFVGGRLAPENYPLPAQSYVLENRLHPEGKLSYRDVTEQIAPDLVRPGMVTDAVWTDFDGDNTIDLVIVGEWMPLRFFKNTNGKFLDMTNTFGMEKTTGWWNRIVSEDFDGDGDNDFVVGNLGLNYKYKASEKEPFDIYAKDFDKNNRLDIVLGYYSNGTLFPVRGRQCSSQAIMSVKLKYESYGAFAESSLEDVYTKEALDSALHYQALTFASSYVENLGNGKFKVTPLPNEAQFSSMNGIVVDDYDNDGNLDLLVAGNFYVSEVETPRNDASLGLLLLGKGDGTFIPVPASKSGLYAPYDTRDVKPIETKWGKAVLLANNNDRLRVLRVQKK